MAPCPSAVGRALCRRPHLVLEPFPKPILTSSCLASHSRQSTISSRLLGCHSSHMGRHRILLMGRLLLHEMALLLPWNCQQQRHPDGAGPVISNATPFRDIHICWVPTICIHSFGAFTRHKVAQCLSALETVPLQLVHHAGRTSGQYLQQPHLRQSHRTTVMWASSGSQ